MRSLHLIDIENLAGPEHRRIRGITWATATYRAVVEIGPMDQIIVGTNMSPKFRLAVGLMWPGARMVARRGPNGADLALRAAVDPDWVVRHGFARVAIGSGDGAFVDLAVVLKRAGVVAEVIGRRDSIRRALAAVSDRVIVLR